MQQEAEDVASVNHGIDATLLQLLSQPGLHGAQRVEQRHCGGGGGGGARARARRASRGQTVQGNWAERAHGLRWRAPSKCEASPGAGVPLVPGGDFHSREKERSSASRRSTDVRRSRPSRPEVPPASMTGESAS